MAILFNDEPAGTSALIDAGADINMHGRTLLHFAAFFGADPAVISVLIEAGVDPKLTDRNGKTAWDLIQENTHLESTDAYQKLLGDYQ